MAPEGELERPWRHPGRSGDVTDGEVLVSVLLDEGDRVPDRLGRDRQVLRGFDLPAHRLHRRVGERGEGNRCQEPRGLPDDERTDGEPGPARQGPGDVVDGLLPVALGRLADRAGAGEQQVPNPGRRRRDVSQQGEVDADATRPRLVPGPVNSTGSVVPRDADGFTGTDLLPDPSCFGLVGEQPALTGDEEDGLRRFGTIRCP
jgi:hypothetical protein